MPAPGFFDFGAISQGAVDDSTIDQLADRYCEEKARKNRTTGQRYRSELGFFFDTLRRFGGDPELPSRAQCDRYLAYLAMPHQSDHPGTCVRECQALPYAPASIARRRDVIAGFYEYVCTIPGRPNVNPAKHLVVGTRDTDPDDVDTLTGDELTTLWNAAQARRWRDAVAVGLGAGFGMRRNEIASARAENLGDIEGRPTLKFWRVKAQRWQTEFIPAPLHKVILTSLDGRTSGPLVHRINNSRVHAGPRLQLNPATGLREPSPLSLRGIDHLFQEIREYSGVRPDDLYCHLLRKTSITLACTMEGATKDRIKKFYGHLSDRDHFRYNAFAHKVFVREIVNPIQGRGYWRLNA
ncbi:hypothetical protein AB0M10_15400 [Streptomyces sp. NPDC051840]|uniref:tyrosine-type recombinase/integrase n=1 Tax=Streptomyces sp. NPDC051840 TaxID=3154752 RepID=UPI00341A02A6